MMNMVDIIMKKRNGGVLTREEIGYFVKGYTEGRIPDYQASALLMAIYFRDINDEETYILTDEMEHSGDIVDLSAIAGIKVDKHSSGGVGDKTSFIVAPIAASCGVKVAKMSGRALGFTGGTIDKMESIPGMKSALHREEFTDQVNRIGMAITGQTAHVATADKKLYALRDVTATIENIGLITSSIMSKKLACGSDAIVLDVKCGNGAFMKTEEDAVKLGTKMVEIGKMAGKRMFATISDMEQPLGRAVGNSLEIIEAIEVLKGKGDSDITDFCETVAGVMIYAGGCAGSLEEGKKKAEKAVESGAALAVMKDFIAAQGGDIRVIDDYSLFAQPKFAVDVTSPESGYVAALAAEAVGFASQHSGAGRERKEDDIDPSAGIYLRKKTGEKVEKGEVIATVYGCDESKVNAAAAELVHAYSFSDKKTVPPPIIRRIIGE